MNNTSRPEPKPFRKQVYVADDGQAYVSCSGELAGDVARAFGPSAQQTRQMLRELKTCSGWSEAALAAVLGSPRNTVRKWLAGSRNASGAARKLVWVLHANFVKEEPVIDVFDLICWGAQHQVDPKPLSLITPPEASRPPR